MLSYIYSSGIDLVDLLLVVVLVVLAIVLIRKL